MALILTIDIDAAQVDAVSDRLWTLGTNGVAELPSETGARLLAGFETKEEAEVAQAEFGGAVSPVDPSAWGAPEATTIDVGGRSLTIEAGQSFGHGAHPTTQLCLSALKRHVANGSSVLDVGCGSGVLSLAAKALGASSVTAIDIDPTAITATSENARANHLTIDIADTPVPLLAGPFDLVVINMLVAELAPIADDVRRLSTGLVILSGALIDQASRWPAMFPGCDVVEETTNGEWAGMVLRTHD